MTDGGQIGDNITVFAEQNHSQTVIASSILTDNKLIVGNDSLQIKVVSFNQKGIIIIGPTGQITFCPVPDGIDGYNKLLAVDNAGNLVWTDKEEE